MNVRSSPSPSGTSLREQILSEDDLSFCGGQSLLPDRNPIGEGAHGGGAEAMVSDFPSDPMTFGPCLVTSGSKLVTPGPSLLTSRSELMTPGPSLLTSGPSS